MLKLRAIKKALIQKIKAIVQTDEQLHAYFKEHSPDAVCVYFDNVDKAVFPYFYVEMTPYSRAWGEPYRERRIKVNIQFLPWEDDNGDFNRNDLYDVADALEALMPPVLQVEDRYITIVDMSTTFYDDVLHYSFDLVFADAVTDTEAHRIQAELMRKLGLFINKTGKEDTSIYDKYKTDKEDE